MRLHHHQNKTFTVAKRGFHVHTGSQWQCYCTLTTHKPWQKKLKLKRKIHLHNRTEKYTHTDQPEYTGWALIKLPPQKPPAKSGFQKDIPRHQTHAELEEKTRENIKKTYFAPPAVQNMTRAGKMTPNSPKKPLSIYTWGHFCRSVSCSFSFLFLLSVAESRETQLVCGIHIIKTDHAGCFSVPQISSELSVSLAGVIKATHKLWYFNIAQYLQQAGSLDDYCWALMCSGSTFKCFLFRFVGQLNKYDGVLHINRWCFLPT